MHDGPHSHLARKHSLARRDSIVEDIEDHPPFYTKIMIGVLKAVFFVYDVITYVPHRLFSNPEAKKKKSERTKSKPIKEGNPASPWIHDDLENGKLIKADKTLGQIWDEAVRVHGDHPCMGTREVLKITKEKQDTGKVFEKWEMGNYHWRSFIQVNERVTLIASALKKLGLKPKNPVVIFAETREEWMTTALACFKMNFPITTVYATLGEDAVCFALNEVEATTIFTTESLLPIVLKAMKNGAKLSTIVYYESFDQSQKNEKKKSDGAELISFTDLLNKGDANFVAAKENNPTLDDIAMIMYTSGTTGNPKGVMLAHRNIVTATAGQGYDLTVEYNDTYIGYLPLAHILEVCAECVCICKGTKIGYSSAQTLFDRAPKIPKGHKGDTTVLKPTLMACVPAVMDKIYKAVVDDVNSRSPLFREVFKCMYERKRARYEEGYKTLLLNKLVFNKIGKILGGELRIVLSGGAPLSPETQRFMNICFCCPVIQGYGLTETCGGATIADLHDLSTGTVGPPLRCAQIILEPWEEAGYSPKNETPQGEILVGGDHVALGYFKNPEKTKEDFLVRNGVRYFATGDIGEFRGDGSLKIIDRKKDLLKLSHGEYISLGKVETNLLTNPIIDNICVHGDSNKAYVIALVVPNQKNVSELAKKNGIENVDDWEKVCLNPVVIKAVLDELQKDSKGKLERVEIPQKIFLCHEPWTPASGLLTEALKLKRKNIEKEFKEEIERLYN
ncbi:unnamed protein product, partial [Mesorhabditis belari]|uniref:long-chain-fatty-acid--CoA ligase n=1 Tax=Mesorhabditis belari TaxID=2138241 RepID=A0AAF3J936_9BILA